MFVICFVCFQHSKPSQVNYGLYHKEYTEQTSINKKLIGTAFTPKWITTTFCKEIKLHKK
jgi:hypothetical protein